MNLIKYRPRTLMNDIFNDSFGFSPRFAEIGFEPIVDVRESEKDFRISFELPGVEKDDVKIALENGFLTISGEKKFDESDEIAGSRRIERRFGSFKRSFRLSDGIDQKKISADFKNGVLNVVVPKTKESIKKEIEIKIN